jgi:hypothetical protein
MMRAARFIAGLVLVAAWVLPCLGGWIVDGQALGGEGGIGGGGTGGGSTGVVVVAEVRTFPVLRLELGGHWTDFEIKASTNNFQTLCYYFMSSGTNAWTTDTNAWVYFTDDYAADVRKWQKSAPVTAIGSQLASPTNSEVEAVVVCPSHECTGDWQAWMSETNSRLVWSFVRYDGLNFEMNATGTKSHWTAVVPVEWRSERIAP